MDANIDVWAVIEELRGALGVGDGPRLEELPAAARELRKAYLDLAEHHARVEHELVRLRNKGADA